jgi:hypothetical protein
MRYKLDYRRQAQAALKAMSPDVERLEDERDLQDLQAAKKLNAGKPGTSHEQMLRDLGLKPTRPKSKARV